MAIRIVKPGIDVKGHVYHAFCSLCEASVEFDGTDAIFTETVFGKWATAYCPNCDSRIEAPIEQFRVCQKEDEANVSAD